MCLSSWEPGCYDLDFFEANVLDSHELLGLRPCYSKYGWEQGDLWARPGRKTHTTEISDLTQEPHSNQTPWVVGEHMNV